MRCMSGGVPPLLLVSDERGDRVLLLVVGKERTALGTDLLPLAGETVRVEGRVRRRDGLLEITAGADDFQPIEAR